jgi:hypothetical protein
MQDEDGAILRTSRDRRAGRDQETPGFTNCFHHLDAVLEIMEIMSGATTASSCVDDSSLNAGRAGPYNQGL